MALAFNEVKHESVYRSNRPTTMTVSKVEKRSNVAAVGIKGLASAHFSDN